ncbi:nucleoporin complex subunit 54-domain-containing protein [Gilbertella persicaria]|uniref:nucleoporin complex subunit 54-domain-containing protein n=1 Tax=Gilbertella persicaria TaxID=101096 RepID=UPI00222013E5|nr:nucleoporin complex subunit 54-domain-containing protein [Gilbertella persicaria]KAI8066983.1 nucleoporin complex subunit 54-domain-containing protein [Gilbertella persicaria]
MSFSFGAPATTNTFGGFGTSQPAAPATTSTFGGFGTSQPAAPATGFGTTTTTTGFGAPATSTPSTGFSFGTSQPAAPTSGFGTTATTTSTPSTGFSFGAATSTAPSFGTTTTAISTAPSTGFSFGTSATSTQPTTSLFGTTNTGFGANLSFGNKPTANVFGTTGVNNQQQRAQQVYQLLTQVDQEERAKLQLSIASEDYKPDNVWHALALLKSWWNPASPNCRFRHYFYNVVPADQVHLYQKPADHDQAAWDAAQAANPDPKTMVPALAVGFEDVDKRMQEQQKMSEAHTAKLAEVQTLLKEVQRKDQLVTAVKLEESKRRHMQTRQRVITLLKYAQVLRNKGLSITPEEEKMRAQLEGMQDQLERSEQFHGKLSQLWAQLQLIKESGRKYGKIDGVDEWDAVSEEDMSGITKILEEQNNGVQHIVQVLETDEKEVDQLHKALGHQYHTY